MNPHVAISLASFGFFSVALVVSSFILGYWYCHGSKDPNEEGIREFRDRFGDLGVATPWPDSSREDARDEIRDPDKYGRDPHRGG